MSDNKTKNKTITFRVNEWIDENISNMADMELRTKSDMICVALEDWIELVKSPELFATVRKKAVESRAQRLTEGRLAKVMPSSLKTIIGKKT